MISAEYFVRLELPVAEKVVAMCQVRDSVVIVTDRGTVFRVKMYDDTGAYV